MASSSINELLRTIDRVRRRRILNLHLRQIGWSLAILLVVVMLCGFLAMVLPAEPVCTTLLFGVLAMAVAALGWRYGRAVHRFNVEDRRLAHYIDERTPSLEQRLLTSVDAWVQQDARPHSPLVASLWRDTRDHVIGVNIQRMADSRPVWLAAGVVVVLILVLAGLLRHSPPFSGATRRVVWPWYPGGAGYAQTGDVEISPGDILIRRGSDVTVVASFRKAGPKAVFLYTRAPNGEWQELAMQPGNASKRYFHVVSDITDEMDYYVDSGRHRSQQFRIEVFDLTRVDRIDVGYRYPAYTGMESKTEEDTGDIAAPEGTRVGLRVVFSRSVQNALLRFDRGPAVDLTVSQNEAYGEFVVAQDDTYVVDAVDEAGRHIENPVRYFVNATADAPPEIQVAMPGRDLQVMALEEVRIAASAADDYGLTRLSLKYSMGGAVEHEVDLLDKTGQQEGAPFVEARTLIYLEDLNVTPGDIIAYFVTATDNNGIDGPADAMSDIYFLEVIRTDEAFRRASGMAGGGAGGMGQGRPPSALVENQKRIIAATWKLLMRQRGVPGERFDEDVGVVAESQDNLVQRTRMSLSRLGERFSFSDETYDQSVLYLREAVGHMQTAVEKLADRNLEEALGPEQAALQAILKAESQSRQTAIQMARSSGGAGGSGESQRERYDLRELFDMEMGRLENRYEMPRTAGGSRDAQQDDLLRRLRELAQRQERLNRAQLDAERRKNRMTEAERRRRLEELRREQEALGREAQALSQRWLRQTGSHRTRSSQNALDQAVDRMRETARNLAQGDSKSAAASGRKALQRLQDQDKRMRRHNASVTDLVKALVEKSTRLQAQESDIVKQMEGARAADDKRTGMGAGQTSALPREELSKIIAQKDDLKDELQETEELVRVTGAKGKASHPKIARQAGEVLRSLISESLQEQVEESKADLQPGRMDVAVEKEKAIELAIAHLSRRLQAFDGLVPKTGEERLREAADTADALTRELENLRRSVEAFRLQQRRSDRARERGEAQSANGGATPGGDISRMRDGLERSRRYAQGLLQPWAEGEGWAVDARSIHRQLTRAQIEDFMNQPALWQKLMAPVRELASALRSQLEVKQPDDLAFSPSEQALPPHYESLVETYFRSLSELEEMQNRKSP